LDIPIRMKVTSCSKINNEALLSALFQKRLERCGRVDLKGFLLFLFTLSDDSPFFFRNRRRNSLTGNLLYSAKFWRARFKARSAFYAFLLVNHMDLVFTACNRLYRASPEANPAGLAFIRIDIV